MDKELKKFLISTGLYVLQVVIFVGMIVLVSKYFGYEAAVIAALVFIGIDVIAIYDKLRNIP